MSLPKEPRQLMINLMYLVLTALLAMNVSSEILNAFRIVDTSIKNSSNNIKGKSNNTILILKNNLDDPKVKADEMKHHKIEVCLQYAQQAIQMSQQMEADLMTYRDMIVKRAGGMDPETGDILRRDDLDAATAIMIEEEKKGPEMKSKLEKFKTAMAALVPVQTPGAEENLTQSAKNDSVEARLPLSFDVLPSESNPNKDWSYGNFHMVPAVGAVTIIDKYINDVKNSESMVMDELYVLAMGQKKTQEQIALLAKNLGNLNSVYGNTLTISGEKKEAKEDQGDGFYHVESTYGSFRREVALATDIDEEKIQAVCKEGVLTVTLPKAQKSKTVKVPVKG